MTSVSVSDLDPRVRRDLESVAIANDVSPEALMLECATAYLRLLRDAPGALPRNPMAPPIAGARRRSAS